VDIQINPSGQFLGLGNVSIGGIISALLIIALIIASLSFLFSLIFGGIRWIMSGGDKSKVDGAKGQIQNALIGLLIVFSAWAIANFVSQFFGVDIFAFNLPTANPF